MQTQTSLVVASDIDLIFPLAAAVERWPDILPHYRQVRILEGEDRGRLVEMRAWRGSVPLKWQAIQRIDQERKVIEFHHTQGLTQGMDVRWTFVEIPPDPAASTRVVISHDLSLGGPRLLASLIERIICSVFIEYVASRTLSRIKELAEGHAGHLA